MVNGIIGKKVGMVQIFDEDGRAIGCTVVEVGPCTVIQKKENSRVQLGFSPKKEKSCTKPLLGHFKKAGASPFRVLKEFEALDPDSLQLGQEIRADVLSPGDFVKIIGTSKGKGFAGVIKRHNFGGGKDTHGSRSHRIPGSVGQCAWPSRIFKGRRMPGRLGGVQVTQPSVRVVDVRVEENLVLLKGPVPGANGSIIYIRKS
jgi:large subunit ribosomal protein L3